MGWRQLTSFSIINVEGDVHPSPTRKIRMAIQPRIKISSHELMERMGVSNSKFYKMRRDGDVIDPVRGLGHPKWLLADVDLWEELNFASPEAFREHKRSIQSGEMVGDGASRFAGVAF